MKKNLDKLNSYSGVLEESSVRGETWVSPHQDFSTTYDLSRFVSLVATFLVKVPLPPLCRYDGELLQYNQYFFIVYHWSRFVATFLGKIQFPP